MTMNGRSYSLYALSLHIPAHHARSFSGDFFTCTPTCSSELFRVQGRYESRDWYATCPLR